MSEITIKLSEEMEGFIRQKLASGEYANSNEVIEEGLRALDRREDDLEQWLQDEVVPTYDRMKSDPSRGISAAEVRSELAKRRGPGNTR
ncbi:type II toxin-antitoxin system ParD family antitoxin [Jiella avicenniae]|uniref:Type II toxin-antitoxin system ParD family antitoxin n=1 Tax=Jiella avicenniae TaxID=2907202 RepID=A0A9X1NZ85_9HYPH|nr:type II toxin-antitoxin system ParD family antitoxin [Jiella avicenniae]MCE7028217.1 type II toxin-antitoxin system ParD family antitoxin [Jiella avicenniae]